MALRFSCQWKKGATNFVILQHFGHNCLSSELRWIHLSPHVSHSEVDGTKDTEASCDVKLPEEPTNCCMSGCANCVWIKYAEELAMRFGGGNDLARKIILDKVEDPNMKAFLEMELRTLSNQ